MSSPTLSSPCNLPARRYCVLRFLDPGLSRKRGRGEGVAKFMPHAARIEQLHSGPRQPRPVLPSGNIVQSKHREGHRVHHRLKTLQEQQRPPHRPLHLPQSQTNLRPNRETRLHCERIVTHRETGKGVPSVAPSRLSKANPPRGHGAERQVKRRFPLTGSPANDTVSFT